MQFLMGRHDKDASPIYRDDPKTIGGREQMLPEAEAAIRIADKHLAGQSAERRKALALDIQEAIVRCSGQIVAETIDEGIRLAAQRKK